MDEAQMVIDALGSDRIRPTRLAKKAKEAGVSNPVRLIRRLYRAGRIEAIKKGGQSLLGASEGQS